MSDLMEIEPKEPDKTKVTEAEIIVEGTSEKPYYEIKYHEVGSNHFNIGFGSYFLEYVMQWKKERLEIIDEEPAKEPQAQQIVRTPEEIVKRVTDNTNLLLEEIGIVGEFELKQNFIDWLTGKEV